MQILILSVSLSRVVWAIDVQSESSTHIHMLVQILSSPFPIILYFAQSFTKHLICATAEQWLGEFFPPANCDWVTDRLLTDRQSNTLLVTCCKPG